MRNRYLVAYDVSNDKRLRRMYRRMLGFGDPLQYSVFTCDLSKTERIELLGTIRATIHEREDRVMIVDLGPAAGRAKDCVEWLGSAPRREEKRCIII